MVTVGKLIELLSQYPEDLPVILSSDSEGNWYSLLYEVDEAMYRTRDNEVYMTKEQVDSNPKYSDEDRAPEDAVRVVALWP